MFEKSTASRATFVAVALVSCAAMSVVERQARFFAGADAWRARRAAMRQLTREQGASVADEQDVPVAWLLALA